VNDINKSYFNDYSNQNSLIINNNYNSSIISEINNLNYIKNNYNNKVSAGNSSLLIYF